MAKDALCMSVVADGKHGSIVAQPDAVFDESIATLSAGTHAVQQVLTSAFGTFHILALGGPGEGIVGAREIFKAVGALGIIGGHAIEVRAAHKDAVVGPHTANEAVLLFGCQEYGLLVGAVVRLDMEYLDTLFGGHLHQGKAAWIVNGAGEDADLVQLCIESELATVECGIALRAVIAG